MDARPALASPNSVALSVLRQMVEVLEADPDLAQRLRALLSAPAVPSPVSEPFMSIRDYARHAQLSERTIHQLRAEMTEGVHFHRDGRTGRRVFIHVAEADAWRASRFRTTSASIEQLAADEVAARRAKMAMKKTRVRG